LFNQLKLIKKKINNNLYYDGLPIMSKLLTLPDGKLCDFIDQKIRNDTPEEYVRQNIERRLVYELDYSPEQIEIEYPIKQGSKTVRIDIAIFREGDLHKQENVWIIIECKRDSIQPSASKDGVDQLKSYMAACDNSEWGMWTNGKKKSVFLRIKTKEGVVYEEPNDIPSKNGDVEEVDRPTRESLKNAVGDNMLFSFKICHDHIYVTDGLQKQPAFFELLKVIFCKIHDERNFPNPLDFYATAQEKGSNDGRLTVANRIGKIFSAVKKQYPAIFDPTDEIKLQSRSLAYIIGELQRYSFLKTNIDVKGKAYEELVGANLRGDRGEFFTPRNVQRMTIQMLSPKVGDKILDPSCGTGGFLVIAMNEVIQQLAQQAGVTEQSDVWMKEALNAKIRETAQANFFGIDINPDLVKATKMNMVMNNDGSGNILRQDSLLHPHQWEDKYRKELAKALDVDPKSLRNPKDLAQFNIIATNPPFGSKLPIKDRETLSQYQLAHVWKETEAGWAVTEQLQGSAPPEILFIERCWQLLKPNGRMGIVLPDAILGAPGLAYVRYWMIKHCRIVASIDLHPDTFQPRNGTQTSVLILQKKTEEEINRDMTPDYEIFMAQVKAIGHDKRGNTVYRRNEEGEEILVPADPASVPLIERTATGEGSVRPLPRQKVEDDDTLLVADEFLIWKKQVVLGW
jgi:type I restriction enzyme M protein